MGEDIERMVADAEKYAEADKEAKERVHAKNELEGTAYSTKNQANDAEKLGGKLTEEEKETVISACDDVISWLDSNAEAETQAFKDKTAELQETLKPIMERVQKDNPAGEGEGDHDEL